MPEMILGAASGNQPPRHCIAAGDSSVTSTPRLTIPEMFAVPHERSWKRGYPKLAADVPGTAPSFDEAVSLASALFNPVSRAIISQRPQDVRLRQPDGPVRRSLLKSMS